MAPTTAGSNFTRGASRYQRVATHPPGMQSPYVPRSSPTSTHTVDREKLADKLATLPLIWKTQLTAARPRPWRRLPGCGLSRSLRTAAGSPRRIRAWNRNSGAPRCLISLTARAESVAVGIPVRLLGLLLATGRCVEG